MTGILKSIILSVSTTALLGGVAMTLIHAGALKEIVRLAAGVMMILSLLLPIAKIHITFPLKWTEDRTESVTQSVEQAKEKRKDWMAVSSAQEVSAYLTRKAAAEGILCDIEVHASLKEDETVSLDSATIYATLTPAQAGTVAKLLETECGISRENQFYVES